MLGRIFWTQLSLIFTSTVNFILLLFSVYVILHVFSRLKQPDSAARTSTSLIIKLSYMLIKSVVAMLIQFVIMLMNKFATKKSSGHHAGSHSKPLKGRAQTYTPSIVTRPTCKFNGCIKPVYVESSGRTHEFCGRTHAKMHNSNASATVFPGNTWSDFMSGEQTSVTQSKNSLVRKANSQEFQRIKTHFTKMWDPCKGSCGQLHEVLVIDNPKLKNQFQKYQSSLIIKTVAWYYHGTSLKCTVHESLTVCSDNTCGICGISQKGMLSELKSSNIKFQRFGDGFYLAPNSSKCHDYTQGHDKYRAMLLFDVAEGNKYIVKYDQTTLKDAPQGFDSVYGQFGGSLNYDEIVLYTPKAMLPTHVLIYTKDGIAT